MTAAGFGAGRAGSIGAIVLAAGEGRRFGQPKAFITVDGGWLVRRAIEAAAAGGLRPIVVVLGAGKEDRVPAFASMGFDGLRAVVNPDSPAGAATSLRAGVQAMGTDVDAAVILLADQPDVSGEAVRAVTAAFHAGAGPIVQASYGGVPSHPTLLARTIWPEVMQLTGDEGARQLIRMHPEWRHTVEVGGQPPMDIDTPADLTRWNAGAQDATER